MENSANTNKNDPWKNVKDAIHSIEEYYGINFHEGFGNRVASDIVNELLEFGYTQLPRTIYAMCIDGKIRKGKLTQRMAITMLAYRPIIGSKRMSSKAWETILTKTDNVYTYCFETQTFHPDIIPQVGLYLMRHDCSHRIYDIVLNNVRLSNTYGESVKVFDMYIKREKSITTKRDIFAEQLNDNTERSNVKYFAWNYVKQIIKDEIKYTGIKISAEQDKELKDIAHEKNIIYIDLVSRIMQGISKEEAIRMGQDDSEKYGFKNEDYDIKMYGPSGSYSMPGINHNLMMYIKYLASIEDSRGCYNEE